MLNVTLFPFFPCHIAKRRTGARNWESGRITSRGSDTTSSENVEKRARNERSLFIGAHKLLITQATSTWDGKPLSSNSRTAFRSSSFHFFTYSSRPHKLMEQKLLELYSFKLKKKIHLVVHAKRDLETKKKRENNFFDNAIIQLLRISISVNKNTNWNL